MLRYNITLFLILNSKFPTSTQNNLKINKLDYAIILLDETDHCNHVFLVAKEILLQCSVKTKFTKTTAAREINDHLQLLFTAIYIIN